MPMTGRVESEEVEAVPGSETAEARSWAGTDGAGVSVAMLMCDLDLREEVSVDAR